MALSYNVLPISTNVATPAALPASLPATFPSLPNLDAFLVNSILPVPVLVTAELVLVPLTAGKLELPKGLVFVITGFLFAYLLAVPCEPPLDTPPLPL